MCVQTRNLHVLPTPTYRDVNWYVVQFLANFAVFTYLKISRSIANLLKRMCLKNVFQHNHILRAKYIKGL